MDISLNWLNRYLEPGDVSAAEADEVLTQAGFPIEEHKDAEHGRPTGDHVLDVEVTSNRPDCLSHIGCAREIAASPKASKPRELVYPVPGGVGAGDPVEGVLSLENRDTEACPLFTARVIRGCKVGPSPDWLKDCIEAIGQRSINNAVDLTNFITFELGNPCHVFDLAKLSGSSLVIRRANEGEKLRTLDEKDRVLKASDLVVADAERAQSLAGVIGGADSEVDESTTDIVFEMATWDPVTVRTQARRLAIVTDAGYRFQRGVDPRTIGAAAERAVALLCELTGGTPCAGVLSAGRPMPETRVVSLRPSRVAKVLGIEVPAGEAIGLLRGLELGVEQVSEDELRCEIPPHRDRDLTREIDLIEEIARVKGYDAVPEAPAISAAVKAPQAERRALAEVGRVLTGMGFSETVTFSFTSPKRAALFMPPGLRTAAVDDDRRKEEPALRPTALTGLLECRRANQDARSAAPGDVRLFELSAVFAEVDEPTPAGVVPDSVERRNLTLLLDVPGDEGSTKRSVADRQAGLRAMRAVIDALVRATHGAAASAVVEPAEPPMPGWDASASAKVMIETGAGREMLGMFGLLSGAALAEFGLDTPAVAAEIGVVPLVAGFPPASLAHALPSYPHIERDLSLIVAEPTPWQRVESLVGGLGLDMLESCGFVGAFRGKQVGAGKKSVTLRLRFRSDERTLRHEEVDPQVESVVAAAKTELGAELRG